MLLKRSVQRIATFDKLQKVMPYAPAFLLSQILEEFDKSLEIYEINNPCHLAAFIAQGAVDTCELRNLTENLNYSKGKLLELWPDLFRRRNVNDFANNARKFGNLLYANKLGNGDIESGDGYEYRARGWISIIGRDAYTMLTQLIGVDFINFPDLISAPRYAILSACVIWDHSDLYQFSDEGDIKLLFRKLNGSNKFLKERIYYFNKAMHVLTDK